MRWGPRWSQSEGGPLAHALGASVVPKRRRPPRPCTWRPWWSQSEGGPLPTLGPTGGGWVGGSQNFRRVGVPGPPHPRVGCCMGPTRTWHVWSEDVEPRPGGRWGPLWSQSEGGPHTHAVGDSVHRGEQPQSKRSVAPTPSTNAAWGPFVAGPVTHTCVYMSLHITRHGPRWSIKRRSFARLARCGGGPAGPGAKEADHVHHAVNNLVVPVLHVSVAPTPMGGWAPVGGCEPPPPRPCGGGLGVVPLARRRPPRPCGGGLGGPKAKEGPSPMGGGWSQSEGGPQDHVVGDSVVPKRRRSPRPCGGGLGGPKAKVAPTRMQRGPSVVPKRGGPHAHAAGAPVVPKRRRPPRPCGGGPGGPKAKEAPTPMRWGPQWFRAKEAPTPWVVVPKRRRAPRPCGGGLGGPKAKEAPAHVVGASVVPKRRAPTPMRWGPRWSQSEGCPHAHAVGALVVPKRGGWGTQSEGGRQAHAVRWSRREGGPHAHAVGALVVPKRGGPHAHAAGASVVPKRRRPPRPCGGGLRWSRREGGPHAHAVGALVVPKRRRPPRPCGGGLGGPKVKGPPRPRCGPQWRAQEAPTPTRRGPWWSWERGPLADGWALRGPSVKRRRPPRPCGPGGPKAKEGPTPMWWPSVVPKRRRPPRPRGGGLGGPKAKEAPTPMQWGPGGPKAKEAPTPM